MAAGISAAPRFLGRLADLLPLQNTVGTAVQSLVVLGVAGEHGVTDPAERVSLLARVLLDRDLPRIRSSRCWCTPRAPTARTPSAGPGRRGPIRTLWRASRILSRIDDALDARPKGRLRHRALSNLPVVGVLGGYAAEQEGLRRAAEQAVAVAVAARRQPPGGVGPPGCGLRRRCGPRTCTGAGSGRWVRAA